MEKRWKIKAFMPFPLLVQDINVRSDFKLHIEKIYDLGDVKEVARYYPGNYGAPGCRRAPKKKATPEDIERQNRRNRARKIQRLILANFHEGDSHLVLTYRKTDRPKDMKEAKKHRRIFFEDMRDAYRKSGYKFKFLCVTVIGKRGAAHHHLIIEDIPELNTKKLVMKYWKYGGRHFTPLYEEGEYGELSDYLAKEEGKEQSYTRSRNLLVPEPIKKRVWGRKWEDEPEPEKGWYIIKDSLENGINPVTGHPYQHYMARRLERKEASVHAGSTDIHSRFMERAGKAGRRGRVDPGIHERRGAGDGRRIHPPKSRNTATGRADGINQRLPRAGCAGKEKYPGKPAYRKGIHGLHTCIGRCAKRLASAVAGNRMEERPRETGKERRTLEDAVRKKRGPCVDNGNRKA